MKTYLQQMKLYTQFFFKIALANKTTFIYTLGLPAVVLSLQLYSQQESNGTYQTSLIFSWLAYMIINQALTSTFFIAILREQGYLKQYHTIVKNISVFFFSQVLVGLINLLISSFIVLLIASFLTQILLVQLIGLSFFTIILTYPPLCMLCSLFLMFQVNRQTINTVQNAATMVLVLLLIVSQSFFLGNLTIILNMINPLIMIVSTFHLIKEANLSELLIVIFPMLTIYLFIGMFSLKRIKILPVEG